MNPRTLRFIAENRIYIFLAVAFVLALIFIPDIRSVPALKNIMARASIEGIMAVGMTVVILSGQLDLSVGSVLALSGVVALGLQGDIGPIPAAVVGIAAGGLVGALNGALVVKAGINSFIVTLATMIAIRGVAMTLSDAAPIRGADATFGASVDRALFGPLVEQLGTFLTPRILIFLTLLFVAHLILLRVRQGRNVYAVGGNAEAARLSGIPTSRYTMAAFVFCGLCAGLAGTVLGLSLNTGSPVVGADSGLRVIAAVVIGGTALTGGSGSMMKTLMGVLLLALVNTAMNQAAVQVWVQGIVLGAILIIVVLIDAIYSAWRTRLVIAGQLGSTRAVT
jgi:ribose/xylose/arabinose/galactoside ABC-type transport system permease subunit